MLTVKQRAVGLAAQPLRRRMATAAPKIGDTKVQMSIHEPGRYINYQRIEDNLAIVRKRRVILFSSTYSPFRSFSTP
jgi:aconitate hydratase